MNKYEQSKIIKESESASIASKKIELNHHNHNSDCCNCGHCTCNHNDKDAIRQNILVTNLPDHDMMGRKIIREDIIHHCELCGSFDHVQELYGIHICEKCSHKFADQIKYANKDKFKDGINLIKNGVDKMLSGLSNLYGIDPSDDNFIGTPKRILRLMLEMNYGTNLEAAKDVLNVSFPTDNQYSGLVAASNIRVFTLCPHHMLPAEYEVSLAYVPNNGRYVGLSKLPRVAKILARSMLLQEDYTEKLVDLIDNTLRPAGCAVLVKGVHNCVQCRGVEMIDVYNTTISLRGVFLANPSLKEEWLMSIQNSK